MPCFRCTVKPRAASACAYNSPRMYSSVKSFVPSVTAGLPAPGCPDGKLTTAVSGAKLLPEKFPPDDPHPPTTPPTPPTTTTPPSKKLVTVKPRPYQVALQIS